MQEDRTVVQFFQGVVCEKRFTSEVQLPNNSNAFCKLSCIVLENLVLHRKIYISKLQCIIERGMGDALIVPILKC